MCGNQWCPELLEEYDEYQGFYRLSIFNIICEQLNNVQISTPRTSTDFSSTTTLSQCLRV